MTVIIDGSGTNTYSIVCALERLGERPMVSADPAVICSADRVILPGVGHAKFMMQRLRERGLVEIIQRLDQPLLGICLGLQLLYESSDEGNVDCLGIIPGRIQALSTGDLPLPHMGWNTVSSMNEHPLLEGLKPEDYVYFVHRYYAPVSEFTIAETCYGQSFSSAIAFGNKVATQFHPERSGHVGARLLKNFLLWRP